MGRRERTAAKVNDVFQSLLAQKRRQINVAGDTRSCNRQSPFNERPSHGGKSRRDDGERLARAFHHRCEFGPKVAAQGRINLLVEHSPAFLKQRVASLGGFRAGHLRRVVAAVGRDDNQITGFGIACARPHES